MSTEVRALVERYMPHFPRKHCGRVFTDTSQFMSINYGDVIALSGMHYMVLRDECERRFGMEDPKFWVKRCRCMETGKKNILKLVFHEHFPLTIGDTKIHCHRSPRKEARILNMVRNDTRFMQGVVVADEKHNPVRILDIIKGKTIDDLVYEIPSGHEEYYHEHLPGILHRFIGACEAIGVLHAGWEQHGDIRRDHLLVEHGSGRYRWIDFDYAFDFHENPFGLDLFGLGNVLLFLVGKGIWTDKQIAEQFDHISLASFSHGDFSIMFHNRLVNLCKLFPYVSQELNFVLMHFSRGAEVFYDSVDEFLGDLIPCAGSL